MGFWVVCWVARGGARQLAAAGSGSGAAERGRGAVYRVSPWAGGVWRLFWPAHSPKDKMAELEEESKAVIKEYEVKQAELEKQFLPRMKLVITRMKQMEKELPELCPEDVLVPDSEAESEEL